MLKPKPVINRFTLEEWRLKLQLEPYETALRRCKNCDMDYFQPVPHRQPSCPKCKSFESKTVKPVRRPAEPKRDMPLHHCEYCTTFSTHSTKYHLWHFAVCAVLRREWKANPNWPWPA